MKLLLIAGVFAGLALMAINVFGDGTPRERAAIAEANLIAAEAGRDADEQPARARTFNGWQSFYDAKCTKLSISYSGAVESVAPNFTLGRRLLGNVEVTPERIDVHPADAAVADPDPRRAVAQCVIR